jgi:hypothetical protein
VKSACETFGQEREWTAMRNRRDIATRKLAAEYRTKAAIADFKEKQRLRFEQAQSRSRDHGSACGCAMPIRRRQIVAALCGKLSKRGILHTFVVTLWLFLPDDTACLTTALWGEMPSSFP